MKKLFIVIIFSGLIFQAFAQTREVPFTLDDRDRIMRTEEKLNSMNSDLNGKIESVNGTVESLRNEMNAKFDAVETKIEALETKIGAVETRFEALETKIDAVNSKFEPLYWAFGILITLMFFILGFIIWDRRTALNPIQHKTYSIEERMNKLENVFREQAKKDPAFAELLKIAGLL
jgi:DNA repair exonuclease SbcCD ATPase subunit